MNCSFGYAFFTLCIWRLQEADAAASTTDADQVHSPVASATSAIAKDDSATAETDSAQHIAKSDQELSDDGASSS